MITPFFLYRKNTGQGEKDKEAVQVCEDILLVERDGGEEATEQPAED